MNITIVKIYPNETVYSWLSRIYLRSGIYIKRAFMKEICKNDRGHADLLFIPSFSEGFLQEISKVITLKDLLLNHTLFKYYARFLNLNKKNEVFNRAINNEGNLSVFLPDDKVKKDCYLRYCPICVENDRKKYGECYYHTNHQFNKINICVEHQCKLINTKIKISEFKSNLFIPLEELVDDLTVEYVDVNSIQFKISKYINDLFFTNINFDGDYKIGKYLNLSLENKYLKFTNANRDNKLLIKDLIEFYKDIDGYTMNINKLQPILGGNNWNPYEISLLAIFEEIPVDELSRYNLGVKNKKSEAPNLDNEYCEKFELLVKGFGEIDKLKLSKKWIAEQLGLPILKLRYPCMPKLCKKISDFRGKKCNWKKLDSEYCVILNELVKTQPELFKGKNITKEYIGIILGVRDKTLRRFPKLQSKVYKLEKKINGREYYHK